MITGALYRIAGVDKNTLETCPPTDKVWAAHLGLALIISFVVIFGITFHATGYVIPNLWARLSASAVIAFTVFMFDRALYQSDWFYQGVFRLPGESGWNRVWTTLRRLLRITARLSMSFGLAWVIALFLELAIFSDTITDAIKRQHLATNEPIFQKIAEFENQLAKDIENRRKSVATLESLYREELAKSPAEAADPVIAADAADKGESDALLNEENEVRAALREINEKVRSYTQEMNAEEHGLRLHGSSSGRAGTGPKYQLAKVQREYYEAQRAEREQQLDRLRARRDALNQARVDETAAVAAQREQERAAVRRRQDALRAQLERARDELNVIEQARVGTIEAFRRTTLAGSDFQKQKDDPLSRMTAYQELKNDPKDGPTIVFFSWMTKFFVIFLEIVPVVAKMFFSPPSAYAARIQAAVEKERAVARQIWLEASAEPTPLNDESQLMSVGTARFQSSLSSSHSRSTKSGIPREIFTSKARRQAQAPTLGTGQGSQANDPVGSHSDLAQGRGRPNVGKLAGVTIDTLEELSSSLLAPPQPEPTSVLAAPAGTKKRTTVATTPSPLDR